MVTSWAKMPQNNQEENNSSSAIGGRPPATTYLVKRTRHTRALYSSSRSVATRHRRLRLQLLSRLQARRPENVDPIQPAPCIVCLSVHCKLITHQRYTKNPDIITSVTPLCRTRTPSSERIERAIPDPHLELPIQNQDRNLKRLFYEFFTSKSVFSYSKERSRLAFSRDLQGHFLAQALADPALCMASIALSAAHSAVQGHDAATADATAISIFNQTCRLINKQISNKPTGATLVAALAMATAQGVFFGDQIAIRAHLRGAYGVLNALGGLFNVSGGFITILQFVQYTAILLGDSEQFAEVDINVLTLLDHPFKRYGRHLHSIAHLLDQALLSVCSDTCGLTELLEDKAENRSSPSKWTYFLYLRDTLSTRSARHHILHRNTNTVAECVSLTMNIYHLAVLRTLPYKAPMKHMCLRLRSILTAQEFQNEKESCPATSAKHEDVPLRNTLIWSLLLVTAISELTKSTTCEWTLDLLLKALTSQYRCKLPDWPREWRQEQLTLLRNFCWSDTFLMEGFETTCDKLRARSMIGNYEHYIRRFKLPDGTVCVASDVRVKAD